LVAVKKLFKITFCWCWILKNIPQKTFLIRPKKKKKFADNLTQHVHDVVCLLLQCFWDECGIFWCHSGSHRQNQFQWRHREAIWAIGKIRRNFELQ